MGSNNLLDYNLHYVPNIIHVNNKKDLTFANDNCMRILYMNCRSFNCKFEEIQNLITSSGTIPHVLAFDETWIKEDSIKFFQMNGYVPFLAGRREKKGGGVGIFVKMGWGTPRILEVYSRYY